MNPAAIDTRLERLEQWLERIEKLLTEPTEKRQALEESWQSRRQTPAPDEETLNTADSATTGG